MFASAAADDRMVAPFGARTESEGAPASNVQVGHDGERQFPVHPESRNATGGGTLPRRLAYQLAGLNVQRRGRRGGQVGNLDYIYLLPARPSPVTGGTDGWHRPGGFVRVALLT